MKEKKPIMNHPNKNLILFVFVITHMICKTLSANNTSTTSSETCPMDLSYVLNIPWNTSLCHNTPNISSQNKSCCQILLSLYGVGFAQHLRQTSLFLLPDLNTSVSCLQNYQLQLDYLSLPDNIVSSCLTPSQFVISNHSCASIKSTVDWVNIIGPTTELNSSCRPDPTDGINCDSCISAGFQVQARLINIDGNDSDYTQCLYFTAIYAAGIVNSLGSASPGVLSCIFGIPMKIEKLGSEAGVAGGGTSKWNWKLILVSVAVVVTILTTLAAFLFSKRIRRLVFWKKLSKDHQVIENFISNYGSLVPKRFRYSEVKRMTNSFKEKLGKGGFGAVYKGKLPNGTLVAVKLLHEFKGNGEDFINEVGSIGRTSHVNIVTLLGFCFEGPKRALIYEFMSNQSLDKFICVDNPERHLGWEKLHQIAVGIARGLEYLHSGCNTRILHFDIKPQNILLDDDFCPKISDFGLSQLCLKKESILSTLTTRGTIGYIAPEVFNRNFGGVSHKSDVYSYGMMLIDMVGGRKKLELEGEDRSSQIYFPDRVYRLLEQDHDFGVHDNPTTPEENEIARKMIAVALWCIQTVPAERPSVTRVIELLEGNIRSMQMPPKPYLFSAPRQTMLDSFSTSESL